MFDSPPPNLPVEPGANPPATPPPSAPPAPPQAGTAKEPEDIFSGLDKGPEKQSVAMPPVEEPAGSPVLKIALIGFVLLALIGGVGFAVWYFLIRAEPAEELVKVNAPESEDIIIEKPTIVTAEPEPVVKPPLASDEPVDSPAPVPPNIPTPQQPDLEPIAPVIPSEAPDTDNDGLSDSEEDLLGTNSAKADTDGDGYSDGAEVKSGYDPVLPRASLSASLALQLVMIRDKFPTFIPKTWTLDSGAGSQYVNTQTGANFQIMQYEVANRPEGMPNGDWASMILKEDEGVTSLVTKKGMSAWQTQDKLSTFILLGDYALAVKYNIGTATQYEFRALYDLFIQLLDKPKTI